MKTLNLILLNLILLTGILISFGCSEKAADEEQPVDIQGSWKLLEVLPDDATEWQKASEEVIYQKHLTATHFVWVAYNVKDDNLDGAGGGSYALEGNVYEENIEFFHPVGSSLLGQTIPFDAQIKDGIWYHTGYAKVMEFDPEAGELVVIDTVKIEEKWVRIEGETDHPEMVKTWNQIGYKSTESAATYDVYPDFMGYIKLITPTHFVWVRYNSESQGGEVIGLGSGTWDFDGRIYTEHIKLKHPQGSRQAGTTLPFTYRMEDGKWYHYGYVKQVEFDDNGEMAVLDSGLVDEIWIGEE